MDATAKRHWTYGDLEHWPEDDRRRTEIFDGELVVTASPRRHHQWVVTELALRLAAWSPAHGHRVFVGPVDLLVAEDIVLVPDIVVTAMTALAAEADPRFFRLPPAIVVEVTSPSTRQRDRVRKRELYARFGVPEYWLVDPDEERAEILLLEGGAYRDTAAGGVLRSTVLPGFVLDLDDVLPPRG